MIGHIRNYYRKVPVSVKKGLILTLITFITLDLIFFGSIKSACNNLADKAHNRQRNYKYSQLPGRPKKKLKIAILTYYSSDRYGNELRQLTWTNKQKYAADHGYDVFDINSIPAMAARIVEEREKMHNFFFYKYLAIAEAFKGLMSSKRYDYVVWSDPDAIYLNYSKRYEDIIDERFDVIVTTGPPNHPQWGLIVNTGGFIVKNSEFGARFLEDVLYMSQNHCGEFLLENPEAGSPLNGWLQVCSADGAYWLSDQGIVQALFSFKKPDYKCRIKKTWMRAFNSEFPWYGEGDLAIHFPGRGLEEKKKLIKAFDHHLNVANGKLKKGHDESLKSDHSLTSDLIQLEQTYQQHNPCVSGGGSLKSSMDKANLFFRRNRHMIIGGLFGTLLMGATYAVSDIREVRYSNQAKSIAFTEEDWNQIPKQRHKDIDQVIKEFAEEVKVDDDYSMLSSVSPKT